MALMKQNMLSQPISKQKVNTKKLNIRILSQSETSDGLGESAALEQPCYEISRG